MPKRQSPTIPDSGRKPAARAKPAKSGARRVARADMPRIDFRKSHHDLYSATAKLQIVTAERATFLALDGVGEPDGDAFKAGVERIFALAYTAKLSLNKLGVLDFDISCLECVWFAAPSEPRSAWRWRLLLRIPDEISSSDLSQIRRALKDSKDIDTAKVVRTTWREGRALQTLHVGAPDSMPTTYARLNAETRARSLTLQGPTHEVYLSDPRTVAPGDQKTIVRLPLKSTAAKGATASAKA